MARHQTKTFEWPSVLLSATIYGGFAGLCWFHAAIPGCLFVPAMALLIAWHSSMQHEFIHGHPTPWRGVNRFLGCIPLSLWLPFDSYRISHLLHHRDERLTDPLDDPESYYWTPEQWRDLGAFGRVIVTAHSTLAGRLVLGPAWNIARYLASEGRAVLSGSRMHRRVWRGHAFAAAGVGTWLFGICHVDPLLYGLAVYAGTSVLLLRSFAEHRAHEGVFERTAIVENSWFFGPLFLFNNLHAAHHERPCLPWYQLPGWYQANRHRLVVENGGLIYDGYGDVMRRYLFRSHDQVLHPASIKGDLALTAG